MSLARPKGLVLNLALTGSLSALYAVFRVVPTFPMLGVSGGFFRAGDIVAPLYGIILGPLIGPLAIAFGTIIGFFVGAPPLFLGLDFVPATTCATLVGLATRNRRAEAFLLNFAVIAVFVMLPFAPSPIIVGPYSVPYVWLHLVGLALLALPLTARAASAISANWTLMGGRNPAFYGNQFLAVLLLAFLGTLAQHVTGGILTQTVIGLYSQRVPGRFLTWQDFWGIIFWIYPGERILIALASAALATPVILLLKRSRLSQQLPQM